MSRVYNTMQTWKMENATRGWRYHFIDDINGQRLMSVLLYLGRILIVLQQLSLLVTPAEQLTGTYRGTSISFYAPQLVPAGTAEARISYGISVCLSVCHNPVVYQAQVR